MIYGLRQSDHLKLMIEIVITFSIISLKNITDDDG